MKTATLTEACPWCESPIPRAKFVEIQTRIRKAEQRKHSEVAAQLRSELREKHEKDLLQQKEVIEKRAQERANKRISEAAAQKDTATARLKQLQEEQTKLLEETQKKHKEELLKQRRLLEKDKDVAVLKKEAERNRERERLQKKVSDLERQLKQSTANQLGDGAEIDLFEVLRDAFSDDKITRIGKGRPGADIRQEVMHRGLRAGVIVIDSKNRKAWQNKFVSKLRSDQMRAKADHAILSTPVFPSGEKELCIRENVIVVSPSRVAEIIRVLRTSIIKIHKLGLSATERAHKTAELYRFIQSEKYQQSFEEVSSLNEELLDLDVQEREQHQRMWKKRGTLLKRQQHSLSEIDVGVSAILEGRALDERKE